MNRRFLLVLLTLMSFCAASAFAAAPTINGFSPASGVLYSTVTITGTNFVAPVTVNFNGVASTTVTVVSSTSVKAAVPPTASTGVVTVATAGGSVNSPSAFTVLPGVLVSPAVGPPATVTRIYYSGFSPLEPVDLYLDTGDIALSSASATGAGNPPVTIPAATRPGVHFVTAVGRRSLNSAQANFTVQTSWPQFGFTPNHKGNNRYENVLSPATVGYLDEAWRTPGFAGVTTTPAIASGIVYACFGDGAIRAFDETTGAQKWSYTTGNIYMYSSPAVANGIVYAGAGDRNMYALDAVTGIVKWSYATGSYVESAPNVVNGIVYFGSDDNYLYAVNATTGALIWKYYTGGYVNGSPLVANGVVYVGSFDEDVHALNAATGAQIWQFDTSGSIFGSPVIAGGLICVGSTDGYLYAIHASTGVAAWRYSVGAYIESSPATIGGAIFFGTIDGHVYSLTSEGALRWSAALPSGGAIDGPVCVADGVVYATDGAYTYALDQNTGTILTTLSAGSQQGGPVVVDGAVFVGDLYDGVLARYTPYALQSGYVAPRPDPMRLRPHHLR